MRRVKFLLVLLTLIFGTGISARAQFAEYHMIYDLAGAKAEAQTRHLPIAFMGIAPHDLSEPQSLTALELAALQGKAVVILFSAHAVASITPIIRDQFAARDDGSLPGDATWLAPKVVFVDPDMTMPLGRISETQMTAAFNAAVVSAVPPISATAYPGSAPAAASLPLPPFINNLVSSTGQAQNLKLAVAYVTAHLLYFEIGLGVFILFVLLRVSGRFMR